MDSLAVARRIVAAASLAAKEYAIGVAPSGGRGVGVGGLAATPAQGSHARTIEQRTRRSSDPEPDREWGRGPLAAHRTDEAEVIRLGRGLSDDAKTWLRTALLRLVRRETPTDT